MKNKNNLYFIPILAEAFDQKDRVGALKEALHEIIQLGNFPDFRKGFEQFLYFMAAGQHQFDSECDQDLPKKLVLQKLKKPEMDQLIKELLEKENMGSRLKLELYRDEKLLATQSKPSKKNKAFFSKITPGNYTVKFSNGRVIWQETLEAKDLVWKNAFPGKMYRLAAATEDDQLESSTKTGLILDGEMILTVNAGPEFGAITITLPNK
jgi:hypothetical protein